MVDQIALKTKLLEEGLAEESIIDTAIDRADLRGGDLASQLLIMQVVDETDLLDALSEISGIPPADPGEYDRIDPDALETFERPLLAEYSVIPFQKHRRNLGILVVEPLDDETSAELSETHGVSISQYIWSRLRYEQTRESLFDEPLPEWAEGFDDGVELSFAVDVEGERESGASEPNEQEFENAASDSGLDKTSSPTIGRPISQAKSDIDQSDFPKLGIGWSQSQVLTFVENSYERDAILYALLGYADWWLGNRMVIVLGKDSIQPYLVAGWSELPDEYRRPDRLRQVRVPVDPSAAIFDSSQVGYFLADKPEDVGLGDLFVELTLFPPDRLLNQSVKIGNRPYMLLVGEPRAKLPEVPPGINRLEEVAVSVGEQLEAIIRAAKTDGLPDQDKRLPDVPKPDGTFVQEVGTPEDLEEASRAIEEASKAIDEADEDPQAAETDQDESLLVDDRAPSGRTLDGTGSSYAEIEDEQNQDHKESGDQDSVGPMLAGQSDPDSPRRTQHLTREESQSLEDSDAAPKLTRAEDSARQTQSLPPGTATSSSVVDESDSEAEHDEVSSTSFGIPFVDDSADEHSSVADDSDDQQPQAAPEAYDVGDSRATMMGGFSVDDSGMSSTSSPAEDEESDAIIGQQLGPEHRIRSRLRNRGVGKIIPRARRARIQARLPAELSAISRWQRAVRR